MRMGQALLLPHVSLRVSCRLQRQRQCASQLFPRVPLAAAPAQAAARPLWLKVRREQALEGTPGDPAQARSHTSEDVKVVGLLVVQRGEDADAIPSRTRPMAFTCWNGGASLAGGMALGRQKQRLSGSVFRSGQQLTPRQRQYI